jgi:prepilin-type N-terminal cleavage/methylation domain-containing protein
VGVMAREGTLRVRPSGDRSASDARGFSLPELLAVMALVAIAIAIGIPLVNEQVRIAEVRAAADELAVHLRAARMIAVSKHTTITFSVMPDPDNCFEYKATDGLKRRIGMPERVRIAPSSDRAINFKQNGSAELAGSIVLESRVSGATERWTANVSTMGIASLVHERVN